MLITYSTLLGSILLAIMGSLFFWPVTNGFDFYRPIVLFFTFYLAILIFWFILIEIFGRIVLSKKKISELDRKIAYFLLIDGLHYITNHALVRVKVIGRSRLPKNGQRFLLVCNHRSRFDPMTQLVILKDHHLAYISKPSNFKAPLGGKLMKICYFQGIIREDPLQSLEIINRCTEFLKNDVCSVGVYPEGTRSKDNQLLPFHEGVFGIATKAKCPIVVATTRGTEKVHKNFPFHISYVNFDIVKTIYPEEYEDKPLKVISDEVREMMLDHLARYHE